MADSRKYYYLKLKEDFFESDEMLILQKMPSGYLYSDILMKLYLRSLKDEGKLMYRNRIPYSPEVLATVCRHEVGVVEKALDIFKKLGLVEMLDNGAIYMMDIQNFIGQSSTEADRKREYRERVEAEKLKALAEKSLEVPDVIVSEVTQQPKETQSNKAITSYSVPFEEFWKVYPRKADKAQAYKKYIARIKDGFSHEELMVAAKHYLEQCARDRTEEKFIKHGKTFLGESTPFLDYVPKTAQSVETSRDSSKSFDDDNPYAEWSRPEG